MLRQAGPGLIDQIYFCPDLSESGSQRRKPEPGMVLESAAEHKIDLSRSFFIGDKDAVGAVEWILRESRRS